MKGSYAALPALEINGKVQQVSEGTGAIRAYEAMMYGVVLGAADRSCEVEPLL
jgi:hypothetical protein